MFGDALVPQEYSTSQQPLQGNSTCHANIPLSVVVVAYQEVDLKDEKKDTHEYTKD